MSILKTIYRYRALSGLPKDVRAKAIYICESLRKMAKHEPFGEMRQVLNSVNEEDRELLTSHFILACSEGEVLQMAISDICRNILIDKKCSIDSVYWSNYGSNEIN